MAQSNYGWKGNWIHQNQRAFCDGCVKFYDVGSDYKILTPDDYFIWCGDKGKGIVNSVGKANGMKDIYYYGQEDV